MTTPDTESRSAQRWSAQLLIPNAGDLCEGPRWDERTQRLLWTDIYRSVVCEATADGQVVARHDSPSPVGSFAPRRGGGFVAATETGFALVDSQWQHWQPLGSQRTSPGSVRSNDGACDPRGRFLAGTMGHHEEPDLGNVYRLEARSADGRVAEPEVVIPGTTVSNGIDWSPDGRTMYYVDSATQRVDVFDYDLDAGTPTRRRAFTEVRSEQGCPDGLTVDAHGGVWVALWDGGQVRRYDSAGQLIGVVSVPVQRVTSCAFGGPDLDLLFITTARRWLDDEALAAHPDSGSIFVCRPDATGRPVARYNG
jgi:sugar lactone lactonase YvrE